VLCFCFVCSPAIAVGDALGQGDDRFFFFFLFFPSVSRVLVQDRFLLIDGFRFFFFFFWVAGFLVGLPGHLHGALCVSVWVFYFHAGGELSWKTRVEYSAGGWAREAGGAAPLRGGRSGGGARSGCAFGRGNATTWVDPKKKQHIAHKGAGGRGGPPSTWRRKKGRTVWRPAMVAFQDASG